MKKTSVLKGKLTLHKETLKILSPEHIAEARGGLEPPFESTMEKTCGHSCVILDSPRR